MEQTINSSQEIQPLLIQEGNHSSQSLLVAECINQIGMGPYQWSLFVLCGMGWAFDSVFKLIILDVHSSNWGHSSASSEGISFI